jgi:bifunctional non-homologous end joining protein LigD
VTGVVLTARRKVSISHADRVIFPAVGLTKLDLARYYGSVGAVMVPHVRGRPLALNAFPHGVDGDGFFVKDVPRHFPGWIATAAVPKREGGTIHQVLANDTATLVYLAGQNMLTPHIWTSRADRLERPDRLVFDLDPSTQRFADVRAAARTLGEILRDLGLAPHAMTTGSRGLHVVTPLRRTASYDEVHDFARAVAAVLVARDPGALTTESAGIGAATVFSSTSAATPTASTPSLRTPSAPCPRRRSQPRCGGRSWTTAGWVRRPGRS